MFVETAWAQGAAQPSMVEMVFPFVLMFGVIYFFMIRPQVKRQKDHDTFLGGLKKGQSVLTSGGVLGTIDSIAEQFVTMEVASNVKIKVMKKDVFAMPDRPKAQEQNKKKS